MRLVSSSLPASIIAFVVSVLWTIFGFTGTPLVFVPVLATALAIPAFSWALRLFHRTVNA